MSGELSNDSSNVSVAAADITIPTLAAEQPYPPDSMADPAPSDLESALEGETPMHITEIPPFSPGLFRLSPAFPATSEPPIISTSTTDQGEFAESSNPNAIRASETDRAIAPPIGQFTEADLLKAEYQAYIETALSSLSPAEQKPTNKPIEAGKFISKLCSRSRPILPNNFRLKSAYLIVKINL